MKKIVLFLLLMMSATTIHTTTSDTVETNDSLAITASDSTKTATVKKHPWLAGLEIVGFNVALVGFNYVNSKEQAWTNVTMNTIKHNITHKYWSWDQDEFDVNAWRHPVHGAVFYLIARANGMSVAESSLYTLGGTWMWEIFGEAEEPSINDMVYTTIGGITIGETVWRSGKCIIDIFKKKRKGITSAPFTTSLSLGYRSFKGYETNRKGSPYLTWEATYGDLFDETKRGPFDNFDISGTIVTGQGKKFVSQIRIDNQLWSRPITDEPQTKIVAGLYNHFDYYCAASLENLENKVPDSYCYSEVGAIGPGIAYRLGEHTRWEQQLYISGIMMGVVPEYNYHSSSRGYSYGSGYGARLYSMLTVGDWLRMGVRAQCSHLFTWDGFYEDDTSRTRDGDPSIQGETGNALTAIVAPTVEVRLMKHLSLQGSGQFMHTHLNYKYHPHTSTHAWEWQVGVKYTIHN